MSTLENKCPLCGKINPTTEWVCEDCGAQLPLSGQRAIVPPTNSQSHVPQPALAPTTDDKRFKITIVGAFLLFSIVGIAQWFLDPRSIRFRENVERTISDPTAMPPLNNEASLLLFLCFLLMFVKRSIPLLLRYLAKSTPGESDRVAWLRITHNIVAAAFALFLFSKIGASIWILPTILIFCVLSCLGDWFIR